jgi:hypothetical protein
MISPDRLAWFTLNQLQLNNDLLILQLQMQLYGNENNWGKHDRRLEQLIARRNKIAETPISVPEDSTVDTIWRHPEP